MFSNVLLAVDLDGTFLTDDKTILDKDMAAVNEFRENGGLFTFATGRGESYSRSVATQANIDIPIVTFNGAAVYDFRNERVLWQSILEKNARELMMHIRGMHPTLGVDVFIGQEIYSTSRNRRSDEHFNYIRQKPIRCSIDDVPADNWTKILLVDEAEVISEIVEYSAKLDLSGVQVVCSSPVYFEILPIGTNKWSGLRKLIELSGFDDRFVVAVGDYMNDLEMVKRADLGIAVENAVDEVKEHADLIVCDNNSGAVCETVEILNNSTFAFAKVREKGAGIRE